MNKKLSQQEIKGTSDWEPGEFLIRKYIFDTWRRVCLRYGFEEYLTPILENADIYRVKSGEDVGTKELLVFKDSGNRELALRPEMTPSVVRMVTKNYRSSPKPIRLFSIANFFRNEKPQRGRNREFWQLNCDIFGSDSGRSDEEVIRLALDIMLEFNPPKNSFVLKLNSRFLLEAFFESLSLSSNLKIEFFRILDKKNKLKNNEFDLRLKNIGLKDEDIISLNNFMLGDKGDYFSNLANKSSKIAEAYEKINLLIEYLNKLSYQGLVEFDPSVIRGFDYYNGLVFEVYDKHPDNNRALFGGGRYNGLANIFGESDFPAIGFAPGDETMKIFLESWGLLSKIKDLKIESYYLPLIDNDLSFDIDLLAKKLRDKGFNIILGLEEQKISKALDFANKKNINKIIILGKEELEEGVYKVKNMSSGKDEVFKL